MDDCVVVFYRLYTEIVSEIFFRLAQHTSHCGWPPDGVSFLIGSENALLCCLIGRILVSASCLLLPGCIWPSCRLLTKERRKSNCERLFSATMLYNMLPFTMLKSLVSSYGQTPFVTIYCIWQDKLLQIKPNIF